ncbi:synaptonemal complex protein 1 [Clupea harengus]|uniref:Synaptonemal complex protein 1 n=1 Tax=Clupea harengus TaxID=7950 RepID=A0A8M1KHV0_CLUHA|nr:synaptonemal complex protein 1 [Clupea harengus]
MERERGFNFRLLVPPRSNAGQVSAVRPQDIFDDNGSCGFEKVKLVISVHSICVMSFQTPVRAGQLYSKLFEEAEKIKCWKSKLDSETSQKDRKLQENKRTIETQRKAIQDLQFENERLSMKLEDQINDNTDLRNKNNGTRNLCNILKDTFERSAEKMNLFEGEREETHHLLMQNSEVIQEKATATARTLHLTKQEHEKVIAEKVVKLEELIAIREQQADQLSELQQTTQALQDLLATQKQRTEELEHKLSSVSEELNQKNTELGEITEEKDKADRQIQILKIELDEKSKSVTTLEEQIEATEAKISELTMEIEKKNGEILQLQSKVTITSDEREAMKKTLEATLNEQNNLKEITEALQAKLHESEEQLSVALRKEMDSEKEIERLKKDTEQHQKQCDMLTESLNELTIQKDTIQQQVEGSTSETRALENLLKESKENEEKSKNEIVRLEEENQKIETELTTLCAKIEEQCQQTKELQEKLDECGQTSQNEASKKEKQAKALELKLSTMKTKFENKAKAHDDIQKENKGLLKQISKSDEKKTQLETEINQLREEAQRVQSCHEEELERVSSDLSAKSGSEAELREEVKTLKQAANNALKSKEDSEVTCQHKISDMVALMDKHKNQYDKMVKEKDSALEERMKKAMEMSGSKTSLERELSQLQIENGHMKQQLGDKKKETERLSQEVEELKKSLKSQEKDHTQIEENLKKDISDLKKQIKSLKKDKPQVIPKTNEQELTRKVQRDLATPKVSTAKRSAFVMKDVDDDPFFATPSRRAAIDVFDTPQTNVKDVLQTPSRTSGSKIRATPRIKSFRIRTPPSSEKSVPWRKATLELDPKSDSSEADLLGFAAEPKDATPRHFSAPLRKTVTLDKKTPSPAVQKSPGEALKLAAMKRMRDAGWTAVASLDRKKKKENIFA